MKPLGSILRSLFATTLFSETDQRMRASIARLNAVSDTILTETRTDRAAATDDLAESR